MRKLVFGVKDMELRKKIIAKHNEADDLSAAERRKDVERLRLTALKARERLQGNAGWTSAAVTAGLFVTFGYWWFNLAGAIAGAVVGFFIGQGHVHKTRAELLQTATNAEQEWKDAQTEDEADRVQPAFFSRAEARTGQEDEAFTQESAFATRIRRFHVQNQASA